MISCFWKMFGKLRTIVLREWACQLPLSWRHSLYLITHVGKLIFLIIIYWKIPKMYWEFCKVLYYCCCCCWKAPCKIPKTYWESRFPHILQEAFPSPTANHSPVVVNSIQSIGGKLFFDLRACGFITRL